MPILRIENAGLLGDLYMRLEVAADVQPAENREAAEAARAWMKGLSVSDYPASIQVPEEHVEQVDMAICDLGEIEAAHGEPLHGIEIDMGDPEAGNAPSPGA